MAIKNTEKESSGKSKDKGKKGLKEKIKSAEELEEEQIEEQTKEPEKEEFAPAEHIMILELTEDGRAKFIPAKWTGKSDVLVDDYTKRTYMLTTGKGDIPPFFEIPFQVTKNPVALLFWQAAKALGLKTVWHRALLFLPKCQLPFDWKEQEQDILTGRVWNQTAEDAAKALSRQQAAKSSMGNMLLIILLGFSIIINFITLATILGG